MTSPLGSPTGKERALERINPEKERFSGQQAVLLGIGRLVPRFAGDWDGFICCALRGAGIESRSRDCRLVLVIL